LDVLETVVSFLSAAGGAIVQKLDESIAEMLVSR
jgi:hypothetical protein